MGHWMSMILSGGPYYLGERNDGKLPNQPQCWRFIRNKTLDFQIGTQAGAGYFKGYVEDIRVTKGEAKYTADFDVPTENLTNTGGAETSGLYYVAPDGTTALIQGDS